MNKRISNNNSIFSSTSKPSAASVKALSTEFFPSNYINAKGVNKIKLRKQNLETMQANSLTSGLKLVGFMFKKFVFLSITAIGS